MPLWYVTRINLELFEAGDVMSHPVTTIATRPSVYSLARVLLDTHHSGFPVTQINHDTGNEVAHGLITR